MINLKGRRSSEKKFLKKILQTHTLQTYNVTFTHAHLHKLINHNVQSMNNYKLVCNQKKKIRRKKFNKMMKYLDKINKPKKKQEKKVFIIIYCISNK